MTPLKKIFSGLASLLICLHAHGEDILLGGPVISEFIARNDSGLEDEDGDTSDWIEILNASAEPIDLAGWHLTDDPGNPTRWTFPSITLAPQEYLLVFASGKNRLSSGSPFHTNFSLSGSGEYLALVAPDGVTLASAFEPGFPPQIDDVSYGFQGQEQTAGFFSTPTPGAENTSSIGLVLQPPVFSEASQILTSRPSLNLSLAPNSPAGSVIRFTTDGSEPGPSSPVWTRTLRLLNATQIKAAAFDPSGRYHSSDVVARRFIKLQSDLASFSSNLPIVIIDSFGTDIDTLGGTSFFSEAFSTFIDIDETSGRATPLDAPDFVGGSGMRVRGSSSAWLFPKKQYRFETWDDKGNDYDVSLFGLPAESDWVLNAPWSDKSMMRNQIAYGQGARMGDYSPRTRHFELFFNPDGGSVGMEHYQGIYLLVERIKISNERLDLSKLDPADTEEPDISGGYILRKDRVGSGDRSITTNIERVQLLFHEPDAPNTAQINYMRDYLNDFEDALHGPDFADPEVGFRAFIDEDSFIDQHLLTEGMRNADGYRLSTYFHKDRNGLLKAGPGWDFNLGLGNASFNRAQFPDGWHYEDVDPNRFLPPYYWYQEMFRDPAFELAYWDRYFQLRENQWDIPTFMGGINDLAGVLSEEATDREFERWPTLGVNTYANAPGFRDRLTYQAEVDDLTDFLTSRLLWMDTQFDAPPVVSIPAGPVPAGTPLTLSTSSAFPIYYTLDGTDPAESDTSTLYDGPLTLDNSSWIKARSRRPSRQWGALRTARYLVDRTPVIVISEIHYRPGQPSPAEETAGYQRNDFEFLELTNPGEASINLKDATFTRGLTFTFGDTTLSPGESIILVENLPAFEARYGDLSGITIAGEYQGNLDNDGETLTIEDRDRRILLSFTYNDAAPWPTAADGEGRSLTLIDPALPPGEPASWRASAEPGGSPGRVESTTFPGDPDGDNNGNGVSNLVEYAIGTNSIEFETGAGNTTLLSITRVTNSAEVFLQISGDLAGQSWETIDTPPVSLITHPDGTETMTYSVPGLNRLFARVLVRLR
ncbi:MAG: CotH kinase family protein [Akkermansiaceae bacterium]